MSAVEIQRHWRGKQARELSDTLYQATMHEAAVPLHVDEAAENVSGDPASDPEQDIADTTAQHDEFDDDEDSLTEEEWRDINAEMIQAAFRGFQIRQLFRDAEDEDDEIAAAAVDALVELGAQLADSDDEDPMMQ